MSLSYNVHFLNTDEQTSARDFFYLCKNILQMIAICPSILICPQTNEHLCSQLVVKNNNLAHSCSFYCVDVETLQDDHSILMTWFAGMSVKC